MTRKAEITSYFPVYLDLRHSPCLVVGGGRVAYRKILSLQECGADITVVAPQVAEGIEQLAREQKIQLAQREFVESDINGKSLVFSATNQGELNNQIAELCRKHRIPINVVDYPSLCSFLVPSVIRRESLCLAISTGGKSPLFARRLRERLEEIITEEYGEFVELLGQAREKVKQAYPEDIEKRRRAFEALVNSDMLELLLSGQKERAKGRIDECIFSLSD